MSVFYYKKISQYSIAIFLGYLAISFLNNKISHFLFGYLELFLGLLIIFLFGLNLSILIFKLINKKATFTELISISVVSSILFLPTLVFILQVLFNFHSSLYSLFIIFVVLIANALFKRKSKKEDCFKITKFPKTFYLAFFVVAFVFIANILLYSHLPDLDPYGWINKTEETFKNPKPAFSKGRELYLVFSQVHKEILRISLFNIFKYVYPIYSVLIIFPLLLISKQVKREWNKFFILIFGLVSPTVILAFNMPMPQLIWLVLFFFFVSFLLHYDKSKKDIFFYYAGAISFIGVFYHVASSILFFFWFAVALYKNKDYLIKNKLISFLLLLIFLSNFHIFLRAINFLTKFSDKFLGLILKGRPNLLFPAQYKNIDGASMGWSGLDGVMKYYGFYGGAVVLVITIFLIILISKKSFRNFLKKITKNPRLRLGGIVILSIGFLFLLLAEIAPRFFSIAFLPDRVWVLLGPLFLLILLLIYKFLENKVKYEKLNKYLNILLGIAFFISISGAFYINWQKGFLITKEQKEATKWMKENLPENSVIFSSGHRNVLVHNADMIYSKVEPNFYSEPDVINNVFNGIEKKLKTEDSDIYKQKILKLLEADDFNKSAKDINSITKEFLKKQAEMNKYNKSDELERNNFYVFYAPPSPQNPYVNRPYSTGSQWGFNMEGEFVFDKDDRFKEIYNKNEVIVWEIKDLKKE